MAYALNTSHALYGNLIELIGVEAGALVSLKTARTFTKHAEASFQTGGTYGEAFRSVAGGFTAKGASFTPSLSINALASPNMTLFVVTNAVTHTGGGGSRCLVSGTNQATIGLNGTSGVPGAYTGSGSTAVIAGSTSVSGTPAVLALTRTATASELYSSGALVASGGVVGTNGTQTFNYLMGQSGAASLAGDLVWMAWFDKVLSEAEIDDLIASLGASNAFGLVSAGTVNGSATSGTGTSTGSGSGGAATAGGGTGGTATSGTGTSTGSGTGGAAAGGAGGTFTTDAMENNTGAGLLASTAVVWTWYQGAIGAAPTSTTHGTGTTSAAGVLTIASGLPSGAGFLLVRTTDASGVYYQPGTVS